MKYKFIIALFIITVNYSFSQEKIIKTNGNETITFNPEENGKIENGIYTCNKINWSIKIPEKYAITELTEIEKLEEQGNSQIKKNISEKNSIQKRIHLIGFSLNNQNTFSAGLNSLKNTKKVTFEEHKKFTTELLKNSFSKIENARFEFNVSDIKIGKYNFYKIKIEGYNTFNNKLVLTQVYYNSFINDYLFGVLINYNSENEGKMLEENFINSLKN
jgi:hypothetical protein